MARPKKSKPKFPETPSVIPDAAAAVRKTPAPRPPREDLLKMIQTASYFRAQKDGFRQDPSVYWAEAEKEMMARFRA